MRTVIHILTTVDGRISGPFMGSDAAAGARAAYGRIREAYDPDASVYGTVTALEFAGFPAAPVTLPGDPVPDGDFVAPDAEGPFLLATDAAGEVWWRSSRLDRPGRPSSTVVELVCEETPKAFLAYLRARGISYLVCGTQRVDCALALDKARDLLGAGRVLVCGGGVADWTFLESGRVDEVSVVVAPVASGDPRAASLFTWLGDTPKAPVPLSLEGVDDLGEGAVHLRYRPGNRD